jgi:N-acetylglutamate synthase-like GNAT family acetyltransferase
MFITRATRHDKPDVQELWDAEGFGESDVNEGKIFIARDGKVIGTVRMIEVAPQVVVVDDVVVREDRRGAGIGKELMQAGMNSIGGKLYLACHEERLPFYDRLGFSQTPKEELPEPVAAYLDRVGDLNPEDPNHIHFFVTAR